MVFMADAAAAGEWRITPSFGVSETFTDNVDLTQDGRSDFITTLNPGLSVRGTGARAHLNLDYKPSVLIFAKDSGRSDFQQTLSGTGQVELYEDVFFVDASASITQALISSTSATSASGVTDTNNRTDQRTVSLSPFIRHHLGSWADIENRYTFTQSSSGGGGIDNTLTNQFTSTTRSGSRFQVLSWTLLADASTTDRPGSSRTDNRATARADFQYAFNRLFSALFGLGYEVVNDDTLTSNVNGLTWNIGFLATPGPRSSVRITYGRRFGADNLSMDASYKITTRTSVRAQFTQTITTTQRLDSTALGNLSVDANGAIINTQTGLPFTGDNSGFGLTDSAVRQDRFSIVLNGTRGRNTFNVQGFWEKRNTDATGVDEKILGVTAQFSRRLTRKLSANLTTTYRYDDFGTSDGRREHEIQFNGSLSYNLYRNVSGSLAYFRSVRSSSLGGTSFTENGVTVSLQAQF